jgi:hypothetical protein
VTWNAIAGLKFIMIRSVCYRWPEYQAERESGANPELSRSGEQERTPYLMHWLRETELGSNGQ